jgi:hypothetical protein
MPPYRRKPTDPFSIPSAKRSGSPNPAPAARILFPLAAEMRYDDLALFFHFHKGLRRSIFVFPRGG